MQTISENKKAYFDYEILETFEAGIELFGYEVKSIKTKRASIIGSYAVVKGGELWLIGATIPPYQANNTPKEYDPARTRKLLLTTKEIQYLVNKLDTEKLTIVPTKLYNKHGRVKLELGLGRGKKSYDKRETIKKREVDRVIKRALAKNI